MIIHCLNPVLCVIMIIHCMNPVSSSSCSVMCRSNTPRASSCSSSDSCGQNTNEPRLEDGGEHVHIKLVLSTCVDVSFGGDFIRF